MTQTKTGATQQALTNSDPIRLIANSGIQMRMLKTSIDTQDRFKLWFHEWEDVHSDTWVLDPVYELRTEDESLYYKKIELYRQGYLAETMDEIDPTELRTDNILPLRIDDENCAGVDGDIYSLTFADRANLLDRLENVWLPLPYFMHKTERKFHFGPLNWARFRLIPTHTEGSVRHYDMQVVFDTRTRYEAEEYSECPYFRDKFMQEVDFDLCGNEFQLMDYCTSGQE